MIIRKKDFGIFALILALRMFPIRQKERRNTNMEKSTFLEKTVLFAVPLSTLLMKKDSLQRKVLT